MREPIQETYILGNVTLVLLKEMSIAAKSSLPEEVR
jgi:hypothetical protein